MKTIAEEVLDRQKGAAELLGELDQRINKIIKSKLPFEKERILVETLLTIKNFIELNPEERYIISLFLAYVDTIKKPTKRNFKMLDKEAETALKLEAYAEVDRERRVIR